MSKRLQKASDYLFKGMVNSVTISSWPPAPWPFRGLGKLQGLFLLARAIEDFKSEGKKPIVVMPMPGEET